MVRVTWKSRNQMGQTGKVGAQARQALGGSPSGSGLRPAGCPGSQPCSACSAAGCPGGARWRPAAAAPAAPAPAAQRAPQSSRRAPAASRAAPPAQGGQGGAGCWWEGSQEAGQWAWLCAKRRQAPPEAPQPWLHLAGREAPPGCHPTGRGRGGARLHTTGQHPQSSTHLHKLKVAVGCRLLLQELQQQAQVLQLAFGGALQHLGSRGSVGESSGGEGR